MRRWPTRLPLGGVPASGFTPEQILTFFYQPRANGHRLLQAHRLPTPRTSGCPTPQEGKTRQIMLTELRHLILKVTLLRDVSQRQPDSTT